MTTSANLEDQYFTAIEAKMAKKSNFQGPTTALIIDQFRLKVYPKKRYLTLTKGRQIFVQIDKLVVPKIHSTK